MSALSVRPRKPPSPTWKTFLNHQVKELVALDFFVVPTVTYKVLFVLLMLSHHRRHVVHVNVTAHPTAEWTAQQVVEAFPWDKAPQYLLHDQDHSYGTAFRQRVRNPRDHRSAERPVLTVAESVCGAVHRQYPSHIFGAYYGAERVASQAYPKSIFRR